MLTLANRSYQWLIVRKKLPVVLYRQTENCPNHMSRKLAHVEGVLHDVRFNVGK